jgi:ribosomal protein S18 acetylase RimI-like enzyme
MYEKSSTIHGAMQSRLRENSVEEVSKLIIRGSTAADVAILIDFMSEVDRLESFSGNSRQDEHINEEMIALLRSCVSFVAIDGSEIVGAVSILVRSLPNNQQENVSRAALVFLLAVSERWRRRRVGTRLLATALSWINDQEISDVTLTVRTANEGAIQLYKSFGFNPVALTMHKDVFHKN